VVALYEHMAFTLGVIRQVDSFDRCGVGLGKVLAQRIIPKLRNATEPELTHDSSTNALISRSRTLNDRSAPGVFAMNDDVQRNAAALVARGKGILAADETVPTLTRRFDALGIRSTEQSRRTYREMLFTAPGIAEFISGVILQDETVHQQSSTGVPLVEVLARQRILPGIKVDTGAKPLAGSPGETITEGLDGLRERLVEYRNLGARFAKWRAVIRIANAMPSRPCLAANAHALARYAALCQEQELVPIVEPEVLMNGSHPIERCEEVTGTVLHAVFNTLAEQGVTLEAMLLKPNMVIAGEECPNQASVQGVATATLRCLRRHVPAAVPGIVFLSGGQDERLATAHLDAINRLPQSRPWTISFSYGRALQDPALEAWHGRDENLAAGGQALYRRARCNSAASLGTYANEMEDGPLEAGGPPHRRQWRDD
jgi:fructose-bisphosphate aldolase class I